MFQVSINSIKNIWVNVTYFNQNFNLIVDAARHTDQRQSLAEIRLIIEIMNKKKY